MGLVSLDDLTIGDPEVDATFRKWREAIELSLSWEVGGSADFFAGPNGLELLVKRPQAVRIAKVGSSGIPAMSGTTPGSGGVTLYTFNGTTLAVSADAATAYNLHTSDPVAANAWVMVAYIDGWPFVLWEMC